MNRNLRRAGLLVLLLSLPAGALLAADNPVVIQLGQRLVQGTCDTAVLTPDHTYSLIALRKRRRNGWRCVRRAIVNEDQFPVEVGLGQYAFYRFLNILLSIQKDHDHRNKRSMLCFKHRVLKVSDSRTHHRRSHGYARAGAEMDRLSYSQHLIC